MYIKRKFDDFLLEWKSDPDRLPLIVKGARQVGKTRSILNFAKTSGYESVIYIDFFENSRFKRILDNGYGASNVVSTISGINSEFRFIPGKTLIFFDEITEFPDITTSLKYFKIDGRFDVICSGSMLGVNYKRIKNNPVGYTQTYTLRALDFEEFLIAKGYGEPFFEDILAHMIGMKPFSQGDLKTREELFLEYASIGGMPGLLSQYLQNKSYEGMDNLQQSLLNGYRGDITRYALGLDKRRVMDVFESIPNQLAKENKKFQYSTIGDNVKSRDYQGTVDWLSDAGIIDICHLVNPLEPPLRANMDRLKFKTYFSDIGILLSMVDSTTRYEVRTVKNLGVYKGAFYENLAANSLAAQDYDLFYYKKGDSTLEEDFIIRNGENIVPIEVKAKDGRSKSLKTLIESDKYEFIKYGFKFAMSNIGYANGIYTFPLFCMFLLKRYLDKKPF